MVRSRHSTVSVAAFLSWKGGPERQPEGGAPGRAKGRNGPRMVSIALRLISLLFVVAALAMLGGDALTSLEKNGQLTVRSLRQVWMAVDPATLAQFHGWLNGLSHGVAGAADTFMALPGWGVTGVAGVLLAFLAGRYPYE